MSENESNKTISQIRQEILNAISANVAESADTDYVESGNTSAQTARTLAETYRLLESV